MTHQEVLCSLIIGATAESGNLGATLNEISSRIPLLAVQKARDEAGINSGYLSDRVISIFIARLLQEGALKVQAPGGINRYVLVTPDPDGELEALKNRVARLEEQIASLRNSSFLR